MKFLILILTAAVLQSFAHAGQQCITLVTDVKGNIQPSVPTAFLHRSLSQAKTVKPLKLSNAFLEQIDKITEDPNSVSEASFIEALEKHIPLDADLRIYFKPGTGGEARLTFRRTKDNKWSVAVFIWGAELRIKFDKPYDFSSILNENYRANSGDRYFIREKSSLEKPIDQIVKRTHEFTRYIQKELLKTELTIQYAEEVALWKGRFVRFDYSVMKREILFETLAKVKGAQLVLSKIGLQPGETQLTPQEQKFAAAVNFLISHNLGLMANLPYNNAKPPEIVPHMVLSDVLETDMYHLEEALYKAMEQYGLIYENGIWKKAGT